MIRICLVDDDDLIGVVMSRALGQRGYHVDFFNDPREALSAMRADACDLLISDVQMPGMSGVELAQKVRQGGLDIPIILISAHPTDSVRDSAARIGVDRVLRKQLRDCTELLTVVDDELRLRTDDGAVRHLDELRLGFLTDLSHHLRTPLTAMKLSMEGLFAQLDGVLDTSQTHLVQISRRNIDRLVAVVENQLDLLQATLGDPYVSRRLVDVGDVVRRVAQRRSLDVEAHGWDRPHYVFTDPERLATIIGCIFYGGAGTGRVAIAGDAELTACEIAIDLPAPGIATVEDPALPGELRFEGRALDRLLTELDAGVFDEHHGCRKHVRVVLPVYPRYDRRKDLINPLGVVRARASRGNRELTVLKFEVAPGPAGPSSLHQLHPWCEDLLSDGDVLMRGEQNGVMYLALADGSESKLRRITSSLPTGVVVSEVHDIVGEADSIASQVLEPEPSA